ncbi:anthranilate phosphoribosyltransferase [Paenibacillus gansuensis]|uniref:Anthranilate phosphoribosyltransferase n=1 Tax=Paenibacillus gansuensis TaxID=306542 RepID=A0ABW5PFT4_9BACL
MITLLKEVGRGKRGARDLTFEEALYAAEMILSGKSTPAQTGAFLVAERIKMESIEEISAFVIACKERSLAFPAHGGIDCAGPYDGRTRSFLATLPTAFVLASCGLPATLHASPSLPPKWGITLIDVWDALGIPAGALSYESLTTAAAASQFLFVPSERWCQPLAGLRGLREELGLRTVFNSAEKLLRFSDAPYMAAGVFHGTVFEKMASLIQRLGVKRGLIVQGMEGSEDLSVEKRTRTYLVQGSQAELYVVDPEHYELQTEFPEMEWTADRQADMMMAVLEGTAPLPYWNQVILNSAVRLWIAEKVSSVEEGIYLSKYQLEHGLPLKQFQMWKKTVMASVPSEAR